MSSIAIPSPAFIKHAYRFVLLIVLTATVAIHGYGAWCYRNTTNPDAAVACLMSKHIAEGKSIPAFFYGQGYMGSLEPAVGAVFYFLFGASGFWINMGVVLCGMALIPFLYKWAYAAGGKTAALSALAVTIIGPGGFFHYMCSPRGGYAATITLSVMILWQTQRIITQATCLGNSSAWRYAALGFLAGLGWWTNQLITPALITSALLLILFLKRKAFSWKLFPAFLCFLVGSAPFWIWNATHEWETFRFTVSFTRGDILTGIPLFMKDRFALLMTNPGPFSPLKAWVFCGLHATLLLINALLLVKAIRQSNSVHRLALSASLLYLVVFGLIFSASHFALTESPRYLLPVVPVLAIIIGASADILRHKFGLRIAWLPAVLILGWQIYSMPALHHIEKEGAVRQAEAMTLGTWIHSNKTEILYAPYQNYMLNFTLNEKCIFAMPGRDRYKPYREAVEQADNVSILAGVSDINAFTTLSGGTATLSQPTPSYAIWHNFKPPADPINSILPDQWGSCTVLPAQDPVDNLFDRDATTSIKGIVTPASPLTIKIQFKTPTLVSCIRLIPGKRTTSFPAIQIVAGVSNNAPELNLTKTLPFSDLFWSGPRVYYGGLAYRQEIRMTPTRVSWVKLIFSTTREQALYDWSEIMLYGPGQEQLQDEASSISNLVNHLEKLGVTNLVADRWLANAVRQRSSKTITSAPDQSPLRRQPASPLIPLPLTEPTTLCVRNEESTACESLLLQRGINYSKSAVNPWTLLHCAPAPCDPVLLWTGFTCLKGSQKMWIDALFNQAKASATHQPAKLEQLMPLLKQAIQAYPFHRPTANWLATLGDPAPSQRLARATSPATPALIYFNNGVRFLGYTIGTNTVKPGQVFSVSYFWNCPPKVKTESTAVFTHFHIKGRRFQDDHVLLENCEVAFQPFDNEVFVESRKVTVPLDVPPGDYRMIIGLYDRNPDSGLKRLSAQSSLPQKRKAISLPAIITVQPE
jgi:4-amino-4-deoxy-L-arabinose transferase-like glycosyltransferase